MQNARILAIACVFVLAGTALAFAFRKAETLPAPVRTIAMSMKGYAFNGANPTLALRPGERVRFVVTNDEETPILHNFRIVGLGVPCERALRPGERREVVVTVPPSGEFAYT